MTIEKEVAAGDGGRELACRCGADLLQELHAAANATREALSTHSVPDVLGGEYPCPGCGIALRRVVAAVRACEALVSELAAGRIQLVPSEVTGVAERPALADAGGLRPSEPLGADPDDGEILPGVKSRCCNASVRGFVIGGPDAADITAWDQCDRCNLVLLDADVLRAGGSAGKETA